MEKAMDKIKFLWSKTNRWHIGFLILLIVELRLLPGGQLGFTCNDPALSHPFYGDTITAKQLFFVILLLPLVVMLIIEKIYHKDKSTRSKQQALFWYKEYLFGVLVNVVTVECIKLYVGAPRPHFFDTCGPKEATTCEGSEYISQYTCTRAHWLSQSDKSFPSGHTSLAVHAGFFLIYYLHARAVKSRGIILTQCILMVISIYCGLSRMIDHRHHWWDVLAGAVIGLPIVFYTCYHLCNNFRVKEDEKTKTNDVQQTNDHNIVKETTT